MDDLSDLAKRVIVINEGKILFDGNLSELTSKFAREKIIKVYFGKSADVKNLEHIGKVKRYDYPKAVISVSRETAAVAAAELLQNFPITDLTIEEEPIENIVRRVFKKGSIE
jgi:ABC-2 type transport system ATP-binding protein